MLTSSFDCNEDKNVSRLRDVLVMCFNGNYCLLTTVHFQLQFYKKGCLNTNYVTAG